MKKILISIFSIVIFFSSINFVKAVKPSGGLISYVTAETVSDANFKRNVIYGTKKDNVTTTGKPWNVDISTSGYLKRIYREKIDGKEAYCLDPGLAVDNSYTVLNDESETDEEYVKLKNTKNELAAIYKLNMVGHVLYYYYDGGYKKITLDSDDNYIIKQILFWACSNSIDNSTSTIPIGLCWEDLGNLQYSEKYWEFIFQDICNGILHNHQIDANGNTTEYMNYSDTAYCNDSSLNGQGASVLVLNSSWFSSLKKKFIELCQYYKENPEDIEISILKPDRGNTEYQRFIGVYAPDPDVTEEKKYYGIAVKKDGNIIQYKDYVEITKDSVSVSAPSYANYSCTEYKVYRSHVKYDVEVLGNGSTVGNFDGNKGSSYSLKKSDAYEYNVIVFEYEYQQPKYDLNIEYYKKVNGESEPTSSFDTKIQNGYSAGDTITIPIKYNDTYNSDLCYKIVIDGKEHSLTKLSFEMPNKDVTLKIYYQYGKLTINKIIRKNNGEEITVSTDTQYLDSSKNVTLTNEVTNTKDTSDDKTYYYFKYISGSTTKYWNESGYTKGSSVTLSKQQSNVTLTIYYGLRRIDYTHSLKSGNSYVELESGTKYLYDNWNAKSDVVSAKSTPWYTKNGASYLKLSYSGLKYLNASTVPTLTDTRTKGTSSTVTSFGIGAMSGDNDSTRIEFYYTVQPSTKVIVRHFVKQSNGSYSINTNLTNPNTVVVNKAQAYGGVAKDSYIIVNNGYSQRKSVYSNAISYLTDSEIAKLTSINYSEIYEIDYSDAIIIDRSRTLMLDGTYYNCIGFRINSSGNVPSINASGLTTSTLRQTIQGGNSYVYLDYYYNPEDYSQTVDNASASIGKSARLRFLPNSASDGTSLGTNNSVVMSSSTDATENQNIAYVPTTENLKPYVVTEICRARTVKYNISLSGSNLVYNVGTYTAWGVSNDDNMANVADIDGAGKNTVYNSKAYMNIQDKSKLQSDISSTLSYIKNAASVFSGTVTSSDTAFDTILSSVSSKKTDASYYSSSTSHNISSDKYNGLREPSGNISYKIYNITASGISTIANSVNCTISKTNSMKVNIYTPATVGDTSIKSINFVNHSNVDSSNTGIIQQGVTFSVTVSTKKDTSYQATVYNNIKNTGKYVKYWYLMFDFDVTTSNGTTYAANTPIKFNATTSNKYAETTITGLQAVTNSADKEVIQSTLNHVKAIAATINLPSDDYANTQLSRTTAAKSDTSTKHIDKEYVRLRNSLSSPQSQSDGLGMLNDAYYLVSNIQDTISIGRVFDFEITDCLDVNFKDVFRYINSEDKTVNSLTGTRYFSGIRRLLATDSITTNTTNTLVNRSNLVVGSVTKILPLGPYKHTTNAYINAVKLGYRFSFDLKTSGYYNPGENNAVTRSVKITPSYYYISKDGKTYNDNIKLYYKNSSGNYINFEDSNYTIYYKPDDGYRNLYNSSTYSENDVSKTSSNGKTTLTSSLVGLKLGSKSGFTLESDKSMTISDGGYLQAWYGEFKLPNSTIALAVDSNGNIDINSPLTDGYIGVKFNIECIDKYSTRTVTVSYNTNDTGLGNNGDNTTQWDYEGYLGFKESNIGSKLNGTLKLQLENGTWNIDDTMYNKIKGTVMIYDIDNRAANDYD